ncbi:MAG: hypothetical protein MUC94_02785 [bacterium]|nr:hypothetical protein [bacterium]
MQAISIEEALNLFDPQRPLLEEFDIKAYYVARDNSPLAEMKTILKTASDFPKLLFSGPPGSGKKTELMNLRESLKKDFHIVMFSIKEISNVYSVSLDKILFYILTKIADKTKSEKLAISEKLEKFIKKNSDVDDDLEPIIIEKNEKESEKDTDEPIEDQLEEVDSKVEHEMNKFYIRSSNKPNVKEMIELINEAVWDLEEKTKKDVLVIVADMDKINLPYTIEIFTRYILYLTKINCFAVYTFPSMFKHFPNFITAYRKFAGVYFLPNFAIFDRNGKPDENGKAKLKEIISRRISSKLIDDLAIDLIIQLSGGLLHELINLVRQCCIVALKSKYKVIDDYQVVPAAEKQIRKVYSSSYSDETRQLLLKVKREKKMQPFDTFFTLINQFSIIEYGLDDERWYDINPILNPLIEGLETKEPETIQGG